MLIRWRNISGFPAVSNMFDDFFNNDLTSFFGRDMSDFFDQNQNMIMPAVNIKESPDNFQIEVAAPGLRKEDFKLHLENNILTVSAQRETRSGFEPNQKSQPMDQESNSSAAATDNQTTGQTSTGDQEINQNAGSSQSNGQSSAVQAAT